MGSSTVTFPIVPYCECCGQLEPCSAQVEDDQHVFWCLDCADMLDEVSSEMRPIFEAIENRKKFLYHTEQAEKYKKRIKNDVIC